MQDDSELIQNDRKYTLPAMSTLNESERLLDKRPRSSQEEGGVYVYVCMREGA